ncbi:MAG: aminotransferase class V-fold PLP-dependent enzyme, partial [Chloroflexi bacterium]|nr:aminotransferase class V-fold PLP-dependent enzyme [Chloroflexota bacterium]
ERFEIGGTNTPAILGQATSVRWIRETVGVDWAFERIARLGRYAWEKLAELDGVTLITPKAKMAGLVSFTVAGIEPPDLVRRLTERGVVIRYIRQPLCTRIATGFYNTEEDVDRAVAAIREVQSSL